MNSEGILLLSKDRRVDVAAQLGYPDEYYFNRRFKQTVGVTPRQYVRNRKKPLMNYRQVRHGSH
ncbi:AraC family transcriptional regulator [Paenibacillus sp. N3.4]|uniref:helix-turn-helix domain-containing protein n=1 Tax=Paenibacillus sp. N3.4 TaxID=2603222 RepID=UPI0011C862FF|nr:AraC family transcriptional regulator [Paenibacillus sp. N3.4]TXK77031.1 AraC family transcriptional regulator [Paenibacillus sp. N3.4]